MAELNLERRKSEREKKVKIPKYGSASALIHIKYVDVYNLSLSYSLTFSTLVYSYLLSSPSLILHMVLLLLSFTATHII